MKFKLLVTILFLLIFSGEIQAKKILLKNEIGIGWQYSVDGGVVYHRVGASGNKIYDYMEGNEAAQECLKKYKSKKNGALVLGLSGVLLSAYPLGVVVSGGELRKTERTLLVIGLPLTVISFVLDATADPHLKEGVRIFNDAQKSLVLTPSFQFSNKVQNSTTGFSLVYSF